MSTASTRGQRAAVTAGLQQATDDEDEPADRPFHPWRRPASQRASALVQRCLYVYDQREGQDVPRQRKRSAKDQRLLAETVAAVICDAVHRELTEPRGRLMVSLSNQTLGKTSRYRSPVSSRSFPHILGILGADLLEVRKGYLGHFGKGRQTTVALNDRLRTWVRDAGIGFVDLRRERGDELLVLKRSRESFWEGGKLDEYQDTDHTRSDRDRLQRINARLAELDLEFDPDHPRAPRVDLGDRSLRRIFNNGRFDHGGRLFGGFWQGLKKRERANALRLDGDRAVTLDFRQMAPRLLYARAGATPPADCYVVPGFEVFREGWKKLLNSMLFAGTGLYRLPKGTRQLFPNGMSVTEGEKRLLVHNAPIAPLIEQGVGFELMFAESEVLVDVLLELETEDIPALPIHDAVVVPDYLKKPATDVMVEVFRRHTGQPGEVSVEVDRS